MVGEVIAFLFYRRPLLPALRNTPPPLLMPLLMLLPALRDMLLDPL